MATEQLAELAGAEVEEIVEPQAEITPEGEPQAEEEPDHQALAEAAQARVKTLEAQLAKAEKTRRDERIQGLTRQKQDEKLERVEEMQKAILEKLDSGTMTAEAANTALRAGYTRIEREAVDETSADTMLADIGTIQDKMEADIANLDFNLDRQGADMQDFFLLWKDGQDLWSQGRYREARVRVDHAKTALELAKARAQPQTRAHPAALNLNTSRNSRQASGISKQELVNRLSNGDPLTPAQVIEAGAAMDSGIYPKL